MPSLRSHTHLQAAQANAQTKACKRVCLPNRTDITTLDRGATTVKEGRTHNRRLAQWRDRLWLIEPSTSHQLL